MKIILFILFFSQLALAQDISMNEAMKILDDHADILNNVTVGEQTLDESYESHGTCVFYERILSTLIEIRGNQALVLKDYSSEDKCTGEKRSKKFLSMNSMIELATTKQMIMKTFHDYNVNLKSWILTFEKIQNGERHTYQYDLRVNLFRNWVHHHHAYPGVEDHNIKNAERSVSIIPDVNNLEFCEIAPFTQDVLSCHQGIK